MNTDQKALDDALEEMIADLLPNLPDKEREELKAEMREVVRCAVAAARQEDPTDAND